MKRLVLLGEGHGEVSALPILVRKLLREKDSERLLFVDDDVIRAGEASSLIKWDKKNKEPDYRKWLDRVRLAARRRDIGGVLAIFDGDANHFPAGGPGAFCSGTAAKSMVVAASEAGAGKIFSLAVVFACVEYETWIVAGVDSLVGKTFPDGRPVLAAGTAFPPGHPESHGKGWLERNLESYRETRDQSALTDLIDLNVVRSKGLRSFARLEHAITQLLEAVGTGSFISTPR